MEVPVDEIIYSVWDPLKHRHVMKTNDLDAARVVYGSHVNHDRLELWKIVTTHDGNNEHFKLS